MKRLKNLARQLWLQMQPLRRRVRNRIGLVMGRVS